MLFKALDELWTSLLKFFAQRLLQGLELNLAMAQIVVNLLRMGEVEGDSTIDLFQGQKRE